MKKISNILLIVNFEKNIPAEFLNSLFYVTQKGKCIVYVSDETKNYLEDRKIAVNSIKEIDNESLKNIDISIVLGGDGSILRAATKLSRYNIPILGINFGTLGYMAELEASDVNLLEQVISGEYFIEERMMLSPKIEKADGSVVMMPSALNDIVLSNGPVARLLNFNVICDGILIERCRADGMVIATPTGSTAYSMSAGGPVLAPGLNAYCLTPICPHSFSNRPVILQGDSVVTLSEIGAMRDNSVYITVDGRLAEKISASDKVIIVKSESKTSLVRIKNNSFLSALSSKLQDI